MTPESVRASFPVLDHCAYLNAGSVGPLSLASHRAMLEWSERGLAGGRGGGPAFQEGNELRIRLRSALAAAVGADPERLVLTTSTTEGCNLVITGMRLGPDDEVVTTDGEHPAVDAPLEASGARVRVAAVLGRPEDEAVDAIVSLVTPRTRLIALSHVIWYSGQVLPVAEIRRAAGVPVLVDGAQAAGAIPVDASAVDFYALPGQKWLCGPEATGALVVADDTLLRPQMASYAARFGEGAQRLAVSHAPAPAAAALLAALEERPPWAFARAAEMTERCRRALLEAGLEVHTRPDQATLVGFSAPGDPAAVVARCQERDVVIRALPNGWLRASCGWWTSDEDIHRLIAGIQAGGAGVKP